MTKINLASFARNRLSDMLQIAQQAYDAQYPLPCDLLEQIQAEHDNKLYAEQAKYSSPARLAPAAGTECRGKQQGPPCEGCTVARWIKYSCGRMGWECEGQKNGKCGAV
jgi:hypothetical protein